MSSLGMDSITAIEIRNGLQAALKVPITVSLLLGKSVAQVAEALVFICILFTLTNNMNS
jgi:Phosphopantetheine attachment site